MKKVLSLMLAALTLFGLCACGKTESSNKPSFQAGFGRVDITPKAAVPLSGYGNATSRLSQGYLDPLYATCIALTDENGETALVYTMDLICIFESFVKHVREQVCEKYGIDPERVIISATHTHSAMEFGTSYDQYFKQQTLDAMVEAARLALEDRADCTLKAGTTQTDGMNFIRHYLMNDGTVAGDNFGDTSSGYKGHYSDPDEEVQMLRFVRKEKKDILMVNWQAHSLLASTWNTTEGRAGRSMLSADYPGAARMYLEQQDPDLLFAYYLGAAGNTNPYSIIYSENKTVKYMEYGQMLGDVILQAQDQLQEVATGQLKSKQVIYEAVIDHTEDHLLDVAKEVLKIYKETDSMGQAAAYGRPYGVMSKYHATSIVSRANDPDTVRKMELNALTIGPVGFVTAPYEMFCSNALAVKDGSPYEITFVLTCTNGHHAYIADEAAFTYGSYEVHNRDLIRGTAEDLASTMVSMLDEIHG